MCFQIIVLKNGSKKQVSNNSLASICLVSQENKYLITTLSTKHTNKRLSPQLKWELNPKIYPHIINKTHQKKPDMQKIFNKKQSNVGGLPIVKYNGVLGEETGHKTPSPNALTRRKTPSPKYKVDCSTRLNSHF